MAGMDVGGAGRRLDEALLGLNDRKPAVIDFMDSEEAAGFAREGIRVFRVLTRISDDKLLSVPDQVREAVAYARGEKVGHAQRPDPEVPGVVDRLYNLGEHSGFKILESEVYLRMTREAQVDPYTGIVARDTSRLGRDMLDKMTLINVFRRAGREIHILEEGGRYDYRDDKENLIQSVNAYADSAKKREEIQKSIRATEALRAQAIPTMRVPFGYESVTLPSRRKGWRMTADADRVRRVFAAFQADPDLNESDLARELGMSRQLLRKIVRRRDYTGGFTWKGTFVESTPDVIPAIVDRAVFDTVQEGLDRRPRNPHRSRGISAIVRDSGDL